MFSPLEQFDIVYIYYKYIPYYDFSLANIMIPLILLNLIIFLYGKIYWTNFKLIPSNWQLVGEKLYIFVLNILKQQAGQQGIKYFPFILTAFIFVFFCNLLSLLPFGIALTSHIIVIIYLSISSCIGIFITGLLTHNLKFLKIFIPECPFILLPILIPIEIFSYFIRMFSLAIRLTANILAGHTLVYIISSFILYVTTLNFIFFAVMVFPIFAILLLELGVAFLQAFVFTILLSIYISDSLKEPGQH